MVSTFRSRLVASPTPNRGLGSRIFVACGSVGGDRKLKESALRLASRRPQPPAMGFDNRAADREAHAHAGGLRRVEGVENVFESLRRQSRTRNSHPYDHAAPVSLPAADEQPSSPVAGAAHSLDGIHDQIEDHL